ncbi:MAG: sugar porter family MFS transporter [Candidatus Dormibacteraeota bacterium]|nr:sugar porter family MFS transporter [Candidatus Dormibacteraeota bacterium]
MLRLEDLRRASGLGLVVAFTAATVGVIYGYDLANIAGALLFITKEFHLSTGGQELVTTTVVVGEVLGAIGGGPLANAIGRQRTMLVLAISYAIFAVVGSLSVSVGMLVVARFFLGLTVGVSVVVVPVFVAESSPAQIRGALMVLYQVATVVGIIVAYLVDFALAGSGNWRLMLGLAAIPAVLIAVVLSRLPDTARWYLMKGRREEARRTLARVDPEADLDRELDDIDREMHAERGGAIGEMLRTPYLRATFFVVGLGFFIQITGINSVVYYSPLIFKAMGFTGNFSLLILPALVQVASLIAVLISLSLVDRLGRRPILLTGISIMIVSNVLLMFVFGLHGLTALGFIGILFFTVGFTFGFGALVWVYAGESFPARLRTLGAGAMLTSDLVANVIVSAVFLTVLNALGGVGTFGIFLALAVLALVFVWRLAPETKGRPLEAIRHYWENGGRWPEEKGGPAPAAGAGGK